MNDEVKNNIMKKLNIKKYKKFIILSALIIVLLIIAFVIKNKSGKKIQLSNYFTIDVSGLNDYATAEVVFNDSDSSRSMIDFGNNNADLMVGHDFLEGIKWELSKDQNISNGEEIMATAIYDKDRARELGYRFTSDKIEIIATDLKNGREVDVFDGIELVFDGISPCGTAKVEKSSLNQDIQNIDFILDKNDKLKNGDQIILSVYMPSDSDIIPISESKTYIVKGLLSYADKDFTKEQADILQEQLKKSVDSYIDSTEGKMNFWGALFLDSGFVFSEDMSCSDIKLENQMILTLKDDIYSDGFNTVKNQVIYVYCITLNYIDKETGRSLSGMCYFDALVDNVVFDSNGSVMTKDIDYHFNVAYENYDDLYEYLEFSNNSKYNINSII